jgi:hypothetical protein
MAGSDNDPTSAASDALSLYTIADQADAYAVQEQSDADFALALQIADEEGRGIVEPRNAPETASGAPIRYRDDPEAGQEEEALPPYRDDPDAAAESNENTITAAPAKRRRLYLSTPALSVLKQLRQRPLHTSLFTLVFLFLTTALISLILLIFNTNSRSAKDLA